MADAVNTQEQPTAESQEHVQAMLDRERTEEVSDRPDWLPEKFKSPEDMAKAYSELEGRMGRGETEQEQTEELAQEVEQVSSDVSEALDNVGLDFDVFQQEYIDNGELSAEAYAALDEAGFSRNVVDSWIEGQNALASQIQGEMHSLVGGANEYAGLIEWASQNLPESEIDAYNAAMDSQDPNMIRFAVQGLNARYRSEAEPTLMQGDAVASTSGGRFNSNAELTQAMRDPRYANDPAYRQEIADKLARSSLF